MTENQQNRGHRLIHLQTFEIHCNDLSEQELFCCELPRIQHSACPKEPLIEKSIEIVSVPEQFSKVSPISYQKAMADESLTLPKETSYDQENLDNLMTTILANCTCPAGPTGLQGPQGIQGEPGTNGTNGKDGKDGTDGIDGKDGLVGPKGSKGERGEGGIPGSNGIDGLKGETGERGEVGQKGDLGCKGSKGQRGRTVYNGPKGHRGDIGLPGYPGKPGLPGRPGERGPPGYSPSLAELISEYEVEAKIQYFVDENLEKNIQRNYFDNRVYGYITRKIEVQMADKLKKYDEAVELMEGKIQKMEKLKEVLTGLVEVLSGAEGNGVSMMNLGSYLGEGNPGPVVVFGLGYIVL